MTDRTCLDVAADAIGAIWNAGTCGASTDQEARAALDAIHPALAHLTPDDIDAIFRFAVADGPWDAVPVHAWEVLSRD